MRRRRGLARTIGAAAVAAVALLPGGALGGQVPLEECTPPFSPVAVARTYPQDEELPPIDAEAVSTPVEPGAPADSDGDGEDDAVAIDPGTGVTVTRGDGAVTLQWAATSITTAYGAGDIDEDGHDEVAVSVGGLGSDPDTTYLVPGDTAPGTYLLEDAAIATAEGAVGLVAIEDGTDRLAVITLGGSGSGHTDVHDGAAVLAAGPGGDATSVPSEVTVDGVLAAVADLGGDGDTLLVAEGGSDEARIALVDGTGVVVLTTAPEILVPEYVAGLGGVGTITALDGPDGPFVRLDQVDRFGSAAYLWALGAPCTALAVTTPPPTPTATPAAPIPASASFTG